MVGLDVMRCVAALLVMWFHLAYWIRDSGYRFPELEFSARYGWSGVHVFFVLSGIVIAQSAFGRLPGAFASARFWRLVPTALICATITLIVLVMTGGKPLPDLALRWLQSVLFVTPGPWIDGVYWTLGIEVAFYAIVFSLLSSRATCGDFDRVIILLAIFVGLCWLVRPFFYSNLVGERIASLTLLRHGMTFGVGVLINYAWRHQGWTIVRVSMLAFLVYAACIEVSWTDVSDWPWSTVIFLVCVGLILVSPYWGAMIPARWHEPLKHASIGTYALYLLHAGCGAALIRLLAHFGVNRFIALATAVLGVIILSAFVSMYLEPRLRMALRGTRRGRAGAALAHQRHVVPSPDRSRENR